MRTNHAPQLYAQCRENHERAKNNGEVHIRPNGERGTVKKCPWPGCNEDAVEGWSSCGSHFDAVHDSYQHNEKPTFELTENLVRALEIAQQALIHSEPKARNYPEPIARHENAIKVVRDAILKVRGQP